MFGRPRLVYLPDLCSPLPAYVSEIYCFSWIYVRIGVARAVGVLCAVKATVRSRRRDPILHTRFELLTIFREKFRRFVTEEQHSLCKLKALCTLKSKYCATLLWNDTFCMTSNFFFGGGGALVPRREC